jgi:diguanylate cyclase (GGDEF)-like protein
VTAVRRPRLAIAVQLGPTMNTKVTNDRRRGGVPAAGASAADLVGPDAGADTTGAAGTAGAAGAAADAPAGFAELLAAGGARAGTHTARDAVRHEALVLGAVAMTSLPAVWIAAGRQTAWVAVAMLAAAAASALVPRTCRATFARGCVTLAAAALLAVSAPDLAPLAAVWTVATVGALTTRLPGDTGWLLTAAGGGMLAMLETVLALRADTLGPGVGPGGVLLAGAAATIGAGTLGSAVARRLLPTGTGWAHADADGGPAATSSPRSGADDASADPLTGIGTRATLLRGVTRAIARTDVIGGRVALFVVDVDRFEGVTDTLGEDGGREVLRQLARRLRAAMPAEDVIARVGATTFAVLVEGVGPDGCEPMARRMAALLEESMIVSASPVSVTCSIGTAVAAAEMETPERLLRAATAAMRSAQSSGRGRWAHHDPAMGAHDASRDGLEADLRDAIAAGAVDVAVQPVVDLAVEASADRTGGVEVIPRWTRPDGTSVPQQHFIAVAEETGLGTALGEIVLDRALDLMLGWRERARHDGTTWPRYVAVNLTRSQLEDPGLAAAVAAKLSLRGLEASALAVEVSAATFVDTDQARRTMGMLRSLGVGVTVDDFGRGALGLLALRQLPVDTVKVDRQVTMELGRDDTVVATVLTLCRAMGRRCIVEGVETTAQLEAARRLGIDAAQGFLLGRPVAPAPVPPRHPV